MFLGKHAMGDFVDLLPEVESPSDEPSDQVVDDLPPILDLPSVLLYEAVCCALKELVTLNMENAVLLYEAGAVPKLIEISRGSGYRYASKNIRMIYLKTKPKPRVFDAKFYIGLPMGV